MNPPVRTCLGCRGKAAKAELFRLAWDGSARGIAVDRAQVLPGRGCYVHPACAVSAGRRGVIGRALRRAVDADQAAAVLAGLLSSGPA